MAKRKAEKLTQAAEMATFLRTRREVLLNKWRERCDADRMLSSKRSFSREEFNDQVPLMLDILDQRLTLTKPSHDPITVSGQHGLHRWQSGYSLNDLVIELEHLFAILIDEVSVFDPDYTKLDTANASHIYRELNRMYSEASRGSVVSYNELRQTAAAEQAASLQNALDQLQQMGKKRNEHLRHSSHDLRSSFSVMLMASQLSKVPTSEKERSELMTIINRNLTSVRDMLLQLTDYARMEAGQETLDIKRFDVSALIRETMETVRPVAEMQKLRLTADGPKKMEITSDKVQIQRILQNLLYNALKYTEKGGIYISWANENEARWVLSIQDTGPGFQENTPAALFVDQLKPASHTTAVHNKLESETLPPTAPDKQEHLKESEGLGLFIVKKICELLKATMDIESKPTTGTLVRIRFQTKQEPNAQA